MSEESMEKARFPIINEATIRRWISTAVKINEKANMNNVIYVTEVSDCLRKAYYARKYPHDYTPNEIAVLLGSLFHRILEDILTEHGFDVEVGVGLERNGVRLVGRIDAYYNDPDEGSMIIEFKTARKIPETPFPSHRMQAEIYGAFTEADKVYIIYISRTDGDIKVFDVKWSDSVLDTAMKRAETLSSCLRNGETPVREPSHSCVFCPFRLYCSGRR